VRYDPYSGRRRQMAKYKLRNETYEEWKWMELALDYVKNTT